MTLTKFGKSLSLILPVVVLCVLAMSARAAVINEVAFAWEAYASGDLDWWDADDDTSSGSTALGFTVNIGGAGYSHFDMDSNGYVELLTSAGDTPTGYGPGSVAGLTGADTSSTYLLAAYDDLSSWLYNYYGYKLLSDRAVFYYDTETFQDEDSDLPNVFEIILYDDGQVRWNFDSADYAFYSYDLYTGLYFGNSQTLLEGISEEIPVQKSYLYIPEPGSLLLLLVAGVGLACRRS